MNMVVESRLKLAYPHLQIYPILHPMHKLSLEFQVANLKTKNRGKEQDLIKQLVIGIDEALKQIRCCNEQCMDYLIQRKLARAS